MFLLGIPSKVTHLSDNKITVTIPLTKTSNCAVSLISVLSFIVSENYLKSPLFSTNCINKFYGIFIGKNVYAAVISLYSYYKLLTTLCFYKIDSNRFGHLTQQNIFKYIKELHDDYFYKQYLNKLYINYHKLARAIFASSAGRGPPITALKCHA